MYVLMFVVEASSSPQPKDEKAEGTPELILQVEHSGGVSSVSLSPDGKLLASGSADTTIKLWHVETGHLLRTFEGHLASVESVVFSPDGKLLASGSSDTTIRLWEVATGRLERTLPNGGALHSISFSPNGKWLAGGTDDGIILWDVVRAKKLHTLGELGSDVRSVSFSHDGRWLVSGSGHGTVKMWDAETGKVLQTFKGHDRSIESVSFSPDAKLVASGGWGAVIKLWDVLTGKEIRRFRGEISSTLSASQLDAVKSVTFSPDGKLLAGAGLDRIIGFWNVSTGKLLRQSEQQDYNLSSIAFSPNGRFLVSGSSDATIKLWDASSGAVLRSYEGHYFAPSALAYNPKVNNLLALGSQSTTSIRLWNLIDGKLVGTLSGDDLFGRVIAFHPNGQVIASAGALEDHISLWNVNTGRLIRKLEGHRHDVSALAFSAKRNVLASGDQDGVIKLWSTYTGRLLRTLRGGDLSISAVVFSPDGSLLVSGSEEDVIKLWDPRTGKLVHKLGGHTSYITSLCFSPDGVLLASGSDDDTVRLWNVKTKQLLRTINGFTDSPTSLSFSPDGKLLVICSQTDPIGVWDVASGRQAFSFSVPQGLAQTALFTPDGKHLVSTSVDGAVRFWRPDVRQPLASLFFFDDEDWLAVSPDGLFDGTADAMRQVRWRIGNTNDSVPLESFFNDFFYPGLLGEFVEGGYPKAKVDIATELQLPGLRAMLSQGLARIERRDGGPVLCFPEKPTAAPQVYADSQPLAFDIADLTFHRDDPDCVWRKELPSDAQYEVVNAAGTASAEVFKPEYDGAKSYTARSTLHVQTIGVSEYNFETSGFKSLPSSASGARDVEQFFKKQAKGTGKPYGRVRVWEGLYDRDATRDGVRRRFSEMGSAVAEDDVVLLFLSGHGIVPAGQEMFYFAPSDMRGPDPLAQRETGLNTAMLAEAVRELKARRVVLVIDACQSGGAVESLAKIAEVKAKAEMRRKRVGLRRAARSPRPEVGVYVIAAATTLQQAVQPAAGGRGALVATLLEALSKSGRARGRAVWMRDVVKHVEEWLPTVSEEIGQRHTPMVVASGLDFPVAGEAFRPR
jgi:WD40 repeat protein